MSTAHRVPHRALLVAVAALAAAGMLLTPALSTPAQAKGKGVNTTITRKLVMKRARTWVKRNVQYSQGATAPGAFGRWRYRTDCSGFVSMAWRLGPTGMSAPNTVRLADAPYTKRIKKKNLRRGDILDWSGHHVVLFQRWANKAHTRFWLMEEANPDQDMNHRVASLSDYRSFRAYTYKRILVGPIHK